MYIKKPGCQLSGQQGDVVNWDLDQGVGLQVRGGTLRLFGTKLPPAERYTCPAVLRRAPRCLCKNVNYAMGPAKRSLPGRWINVSLLPVGWVRFQPAGSGRVQRYSERIRSGLRGNVGLCSSGMNTATVPVLFGSALLLSGRDSTLTRRPSRTVAPGVTFRGAVETEAMSCMPR